MKKHINNDKILDKIGIDRGDYAVSATETTGLIPSHAEDDYTLNSYKNISDYQAIPQTRKQPYHSPQERKEQ